MPKDSINQPFINIKDKFKWEKLFEYINSFEYKKFKKIEKEIFKKIPGKDKKKALIFLLACYLENDLKRIELIKNRINLFEKISEKKEKSNSTKNVSINNRQQIIDEKYVKLFINIGKDKKVFPGDLIIFIINSMKIKKHQIKNIKIFDKYSFFEIPEDFGEKAIVLLSVKRFRGKKIIVNYSKQQA